MISQYESKAEIASFGVALRLLESRVKKFQQGGSTLGCQYRAAEGIHRCIGRVIHIDLVGTNNAIEPARVFVRVACFQSRTRLVAYGGDRLPLLALQLILRPSRPCSPSIEAIRLAAVARVQPQTRLDRNSKIDSRFKNM